jgi:hypothetical protein
MKVGTVLPEDTSFALLQAVGAGLCLGQDKEREYV